MQFPKGTGVVSLPTETIEGVKAKKIATPQRFRIYRTTKYEVGIIHDGIEEDPLETSASYQQYLVKINQSGKKNFTIGITRPYANKPCNIPTDDTKHIESLPIKSFPDKNAFVIDTKYTPPVLANMLVIDQILRKCKGLHHGLKVHAPMLLHKGEKLAITLSNYALIVYSKDSTPALLLDPYIAMLEILMCRNISTIEQQITLKHTWKKNKTPIHGVDKLTPSAFRYTWKTKTMIKMKKYMDNEMVKMSNPTVYILLRYKSFLYLKGRWPNIINIPTKQEEENK